jgi:hypothetical protein
MMGCAMLHPKYDVRRIVGSGRDEWSAAGRDRWRRLWRADGGARSCASAGRNPGDERHNYRLFQPLLYQVAAAALSPADIAEPIRAVLRRQRNATLLL